jgi:hypothetical protein
LGGDWAEVLERSGEMAEAKWEPDRAGTWAATKMALAEAEAEKARAGDRRFIAFLDRAAARFEESADYDLFNEED